MKWFKRILIGVGAVIAGLAALLVGTIVIDGWAGGGQLDRVTNTYIPNAAGPEVRAWVARPAGAGPHPTVIMIHEFWGLSEDIVGKAQALAEEGYVVVAPQLFRESTARTVPRAIYQVITTPQEQILGDLDAVLAWLNAQPEVAPDRIAILGFCFGGRSSLQYSLHNHQLAATIILYGSLVTDTAQLRSLPGPVLGIFGGADQSIPLADVNAFEAALNEAGVPNTISIYEGQPHAFVTSIEAIRQGGPQGEAWAEVLAFLKTNLQADTSEKRPVRLMAVALVNDWDYWLRLAFEHTFGSGVHQH